ncbi:type IV pilus modification protein PilV [Pseudomonas gessardii]|uniref:Type IV pilus modification protein PilV n=2 Tax=Pseudomonas gessardii TaxID=78544 RepID=A0ABS9FB75_9PSED|nr:type IV pilus modification protein PilV [Pseudomonas gessardii]MCF4977574.1 type IV pilus modification protein PilV [Pseudomonas gessardii]MCF4989004.1 type IV pilus modification protein PilV [Pseudomonas gessardii]MCF5083314.1 type IV pilus modification protein PilV [Pseudomonas gessardii]MCF5094600.1 type IV pilus modification protein PilV [Pseudomonas gessardii]MCF5108973.1 type IV pilus modification protein PilV [Pseudomonas gessardii]
MVMRACSATSCTPPPTDRQVGMSLVEVLVSLLILGVGLLGAGLIQLNALKYTDSARMISQASFIAYDMLDRIRANFGADYAWQSGDVAPATSMAASVRDLDLLDFEANISQLAGDTAKGSIALDQREVTISISWDDSRAANAGNTRETFTLTSRVAVDPRPAR